MQFILTKEFLTELKKSISNGEASFVEEQIASLHPADIAEILDEVNMNEAKYIYKILDEEKAADVLIELDEFKNNGIFR